MTKNTEQQSVADDGAQDSRARATTLETFAVALVLFVDGLRKTRRISCDLLHTLSQMARSLVLLTKLLLVWFPVWLLVTATAVAVSYGIFSVLFWLFGASMARHMTHHGMTIPIFVFVFLVPMVVILEGLILLSESLRKKYQDALMRVRGESR